MSKERDEKLKALKLTVDKLEKTYGKGSVMKLGDKKDHRRRDDLDRLAGSGPCTGDTRFSERPSRRGIRSRVVGKDDPRHSCHRSMPETRGDRGIHRCRTCF